SAPRPSQEGRGFILERVVTMSGGTPHNDENGWSIPMSIRTQMTLMHADPHGSSRFYFSHLRRSAPSASSAFTDSIFEAVTIPEYFAYSIAQCYNFEAVLVSM
ncbi:MAG: hypothetical protein J7M34_10570, partial [Anaerolineae bacterium]|nr:hypothetical protein [Anaerolineae bacterium]